MSATAARCGFAGVALFRSYSNSGPHFRSLRCSKLILGENNPETDEVVRVRREISAALRRPAIPRVDVPTAPSDHAVRARNGPLRIGHASSLINVIPVLTQLPHVSNDVIQSPAVRGVAPDRGSHLQVDSARIGDVAQAGIIFVCA